LTVSGGHIRIDSGKYLVADAGGGFEEFLIGLTGGQVNIASNGQSNTWAIGSTDTRQTGRIYTSG
jgi:hypothetical protein